MIHFFINKYLPGHPFPSCLRELSIGSQIIKERVAGIVAEVNVKVHAELFRDMEHHRSYHSVFVGPGCMVTSHRQCASLLPTETRELDPALAEPREPCDHVHVTVEGRRSSKVHQSRGRDCAPAVVSF
jgi:hypothetical protein